MTGWKLSRAMRVRNYRLLDCYKRERDAGPLIAIGCEALFIIQGRLDEEEQGVIATNRRIHRADNAVWNVRFCGISSSRGDARRWIVAWIIPSIVQPRLGECAAIPIAQLYGLVVAIRIALRGGAAV